MDSKHLEKLKDALEEEKKLIETQLLRIATRNPSIKDDWKATAKQSDSSDTLDEKAQNVTNFEERKAIEQELELRLREINDALLRIKEGKYGVCISCKSDIDNDRIYASPTSARCFSCEKREGSVV